MSVLLRGFFVSTAAGSVVAEAGAFRLLDEGVETALLKIGKNPVGRLSPLPRSPASHDDVEAGPTDEDESIMRLE